jgi:hypothetical protein
LLPVKQKKEIVPKLISQLKLNTQIKNGLNSLMKTLNEE